MADDLYKAYDQKLAMPTAPGAAANFAAQQSNVNAVGRAVGSPSGTDWNQTFGQNNPSSPSGTNWGSTFARTGGQQNPGYVGMSAPAGSDWSRTFGRNNTALPARQDFGRTGRAVPGGSPYVGPDYQGNPAIDTYRGRMADDMTQSDREMYGAGGEFGFVS